MKDKRELVDNMYTAFSILGTVAILVCVLLQKYEIYNFTIPYGSPISWPFFVGIIMFLVPGVFGYFSHKVFIFRFDFDLRDKPLLAKTLSVILCIIGILLIIFDVVF